MVSGKGEWNAAVKTARALRQALHRRPELSWAELATAATIRQRLDALGIAWRACAETGTVATIAAAATGPHIALRGDIDALPIVEQSGVAYSSEHDGRMHACGHDGHTATLLAVGEWLQLHAQDLPGPVSLIFQPAEEGGHGAQAMIEAGALEGVEMIYGWHNWPAIPFGQLVCPDGLVMCGNGTFEIHVTGSGGHASQPELCADPVLAASAIHLSLQQVVSRRIAPQRPVVLSVTSITAPSAPTITPDRATLSGSIRVPDDATREQVNAMIDQVAAHTAQAYGVSCEVVHQPRYGATYNHPQPAARMRELWAENFGPGALNEQLLLPVMASEDFSYYLREIPGAFALIGSDDGEPLHQAPCHSPRYDFNDALIELVLRLFAQLASAPTPPLKC